MRADVQPLLGLLPAHKVLSLGVISGRNIWKTDLSAVLDWVEPLAERLHESELYWHKARYLRASGAEASQVRAAAAADSARAGGKCRTEALALMLLTDIELDEALLARYRHRLHILKTQRPELSFF